MSSSILLHLDVDWQILNRTIGSAEIHSPVSAPLHAWELDLVTFFYKAMECHLRGEGTKDPCSISHTFSCILLTQSAGSYPDVFCLLRGPLAKNWQLQPVKDKGLQPNMCKAPNLTQSYGSELGRAFPFPLVLRELQILQHSDCSFWDL